MGFSSGGYSTPPAPTYAAPEKAEVVKPVTEAATAARQSQKDKAARASGIQGSVLTSPLQSSANSESSAAQGNTLLGQ